MMAILLPTSANINENIFTQAASNNEDYSQENNSQHVTNTVMYQYPPQGNSQGHMLTIQYHVYDLCLCLWLSVY